ncbi:MAG: LPS export ABC transporter periplasmic protein LptC [Bacteroidota bacterium]
MQYTFSYKFFVVAFTVACFLGSCENDMKEVAKLNQKKVQVDEGKNISSYMSQGGKMRAHLTAPLMLNYRTDSPYVEFPRGLHVDFFKDSLITESVTTAKYSKYLQNEQKILLRDSVVVYNKLTGDTLRTDLLWWDQAKGIFYTDHPVDVYIKANEQILHGAKGLTALQNFSKWTLHNTTGTMNVPADLNP